MPRLYEVFLFIQIGVVLTCSPNGAGVGYSGDNGLGAQKFLQDKYAHHFIAKYFPKWLSLYENLQKLNTRKYRKFGRYPIIKKRSDDNNEALSSNFVEDQNEIHYQQKPNEQTNETIENHTENNLFQNELTIKENTDNELNLTIQKKKKRRRRKKKGKLRKDKKKREHKKTEKVQRKEKLVQDTKKNKYETVGSIVKSHVKKNGRKVADIRHLFRPLF